MKNLSNDEFITKFSEFSEASLLSTVKSAEECLLVVGKLLDVIASDAARIAKMPPDTLEAFEKVRKTLRTLDNTSDTDSHTRVITVISQLKAMMGEDTSIKHLVFPIVSSLQFHEKVRHHLLNLSRMVETWKELRKNPLNSADERRAFGKKLFESTTMREERDIIRGLISGLPGEEHNKSFVWF